MKSESTALKPQLAAAKQGFDRDGFIVLRDFFTPAETKELADRLDRYVKEIVPTLPPEDAFYDVKGQPESLKQLHRMAKHDPYFKDYESNPKLVELAKVLLDDELQVLGAEWFNKPPRVSKATPPHQDGFYFMLVPNNALTFWIPLDVVDESNGCLRYVVGSHLKGIRPHIRTQTLGFSQGVADFGPEDEKLEQLIFVKPGDVLAHHSVTIHRAEANNSDRHRRALGMVYFGAHTQRDHEAIEAYQRSLAKDLASAGKI